MAALWTQADIDALKALIASGVQSVSYSSGGSSRSITYQSLAEARSLLAEMTGQVTAAPTYRLAQMKRGF